MQFSVRLLSYFTLLLLMFGFFDSAMAQFDWGYGWEGSATYPPTSSPSPSPTASATPSPSPTPPLSTSEPSSTSNPTVTQSPTQPPFTPSATPVVSELSVLSVIGVALLSLIVMLVIRRKQYCRLKI